VGVQEADMQFPNGTTFTPYLVLRNTTANPMPVQIAGNTMTGGSPSDFSLGSVNLAPFQSRQIYMKPFLASAGLSSFNGYINLRTTFTGNPTDLLQESGSVDQTLNYVFEVPPHLEEATSSRFFNYWNTNGDTDTMFTLWNYSGVAQDVVLTFQHQEGKYEMPIHLAPHASMTLSVGKLIRSGTPDRNGKFIPTSIVQGSAKISSASGSTKDRITVAVAAGIFNARTGTCSYPCGPCVAATGVNLDPFDFGFLPGNTRAVTLWVTFSDGSSENYTSNAYFSSSDTTTVTMNGSSAKAIAAGSATITGFASNLPGSGNGGKLNCCGIAGCGGEDLSGSCDATVDGFDISSSQTITDGQTSSFSVTITGGTATGYQWSFTSPTGAGNSPNVNFTSATSAQTNTDGHWFALPDQQCPATSFSSVYIISAKVMFQTPSESSQDTQLIVTLPDLAGSTGSTGDISGAPTIAADSNGVWRVTGQGNLARSVPTTYGIYIPSTSQFFNKASQHEQVHVNQWMLGAGHLFGDLFIVSDYYSTVHNLFDTSQSGLSEQIANKLLQYVSSQNLIAHNRIPQAEREAYAVSDPIPPQYLYQNCGQY
jgi:hypothetical protein